MLGCPCRVSILFKLWIGHRVLLRSGAETLEVIAGFGGSGGGLIPSPTATGQSSKLRRQKAETLEEMSYFV